MNFKNPFADPLFGTTAVRLGILFGGALLAIVAIVRGRVLRLGQNVLFQRWRTWAVIAPIYVLAVLGGSVPTMLFIVALTFQGLREYGHLTGMPKPYRLVLYAMAIVVAPSALISMDVYYLLPPLLLTIATVQPLVFDEPDGIRHLAFAALGWGYLAWFLSHFVLIAHWIDGGPGILIALGLAVAMSDVGAFVVGKALGKHQLAPRISPNKTWEGIIGNVLGAYAGVAILSFALPFDIRIALMIGLPLLVAIGAVWGDLVESSIKREFGVKDTAAWLPGFGGLLDRIDSLLVVTPLTYYFVRLLT